MMPDKRLVFGADSLQEVAMSQVLRTVAAKTPRLFALLIALMLILIMAVPPARHG